MPNTVLLITNLDLNIVDGTTIWWSNSANTYLKNGFKVKCITTKPIKYTNNTRNILPEYKDNFEVITAQDLQDVKKHIESIGGAEEIEEIVIRHSDFISYIAAEICTTTTWKYADLCSYYVMNRDMDAMRKILKHKYKSVIFQSECLRNFWKENEIIPEPEKCVIQTASSILTTYKIPRQKNTSGWHTRFIYIGSLRKENHTIELIEDFEKALETNPDITLTICYGKIHGEVSYTKKVKQILHKGVLGITFKYNLSHKDVAKELCKHDVGIMWHETDYGIFHQSLKEAEYTHYGLKICKTNISEYLGANTFRTVNQMFDKVYVINLEKHKQKRERVEKYLKSNEIDFIFHNGVDGTKNRTAQEIFEKNKNDNLISVGQIGYYMSMQGIFEDAKQNNYNKILVFDDDIVISNNFRTDFIKFAKKVPAWDIVRFGCSQHNQKNIDYVKAYGDTYYKSTEGTFGTFAIGYTKEAYTNILEVIKQEITKPFDTKLIGMFDKDYVMFPNGIIADLRASSITGPRDMKEYAKKFRWEMLSFSLEETIEEVKEERYKDSEENRVLVILPTYNRAEKCIQVIEQILNQDHINTHLIVIDDGSNMTNYRKLDSYIKTQRENLEIRPRLFYDTNGTNKKIPFSLNKGLTHLFKNDYKFVTWVSDDNLYDTDFISSFVRKILDTDTEYAYSDYRYIDTVANITATCSRKYENIDNVINNFRGCAGFMWTKELAGRIGYYREELYGCEDFEYMIRTFMNTTKTCRVEGAHMTYYRHGESLFIRDGKRILLMKQNIINFYNYYLKNKDKSKLVYYSKTPWSILFQRPQQIMRHFDKDYFKVFLTRDGTFKVEEKYNLLILPFEHKDMLLELIKNQEYTLYFTDTRLYEDVKTLKKKNSKIKILFDLIDAPIDEFSIWKTNLENSVKISDHVMYSHPNLIEFLNECDPVQREYHYVSNGCDYEIFKEAKNRIGERPKEFPTEEQLGGRKILGYYGALSEWLDYDMVREYADKKEEYHVVMIGGLPGHPTYNMRFEHDNITWIDHKPYEEIVKYLSWFDICFLPFKECELTKYVNPCKLWEYMASEKEIIKRGVEMSILGSVNCYKYLCDKIKIIISHNFLKSKKTDTIYKLESNNLTEINYYYDYIFVAPYPYKYRLVEGYIKRINYMFDIIKKKYRKILFVFIDKNHKEQEINLIDSVKAEICVGYDFRKEDMLKLLKNKTVHIETTHGCEYFFINKILDKINYVLDIHGAAPEEEKEINNSDIVYWNEIEKESIINSKLLFVVNNAMIKHLEKKYNIKIYFKTLVVYVFSSLFRKSTEIQEDEKRKNIVYSGGTQTWQNLDYVIDKILNKSIHDVYFFSHDVNIIKNKIKNKKIKIKDEQIKTFVEQDELIKNYNLFKYGLILRNNNVINKVSSPTKLEDYITNKIVPIVFDNQDTLGDYENLKCVDINFILNNNDLSLEEYKYMTEHNIRILENMSIINKKNVEKILKII